jgi:hypothetical protein
VASAAAKQAQREMSLHLDRLEDVARRYEQRRELRNNAPADAAPRPTSN